MEASTANLTIERTFDAELVASIMREPALWETCAEDGHIPGEFLADVDADCWLAVENGSEVIGLYKLHPHNSATLEIHAQILPEHRKTYSKESSLAVLRWILEESPTMYQKVIAQIPVIYPNVIRFTLNAGFQMEGTNRLSYRKHGKLHDRVLLGITRDEIASFLRRHS